MNVDNQWVYYNHAMITDIAPHEEPNTDFIESGEVWKISEKPLLARWTT